MAKPDLESHSLIRFLDKFVYRNPKVSETNRGASIMQPVHNPDAGNIWLAKRTGTAAAPAINSPSFWNQKIDQIAAEDIFFHEYFKQAGKKSETNKKTATVSSISPAEQEEDPQQEDEIWKALTASHPDGPIDSDESDLDMDGFDDESEVQSDGGVVFSEGSDINLSDDEVEGELVAWEGAEEADTDNEEDNELSATSKQAETGEKRVKGGRSSRRRLKDLPMFASADDYAELLAKDDDV